MVFKSFGYMNELSSVDMEWRGITGNNNISSFSF
jgi:hypothetical protein